MSKNAYLVMTDLHFDFQKANRKDYFSEILNSMNDILTIATRYKECGYSVKLCALGDVYDAGLSNASEAMQAIEIFRFFCNQFDTVYSVVGNHELTYAKDNPFWFLVSTVEDISLVETRKYLQPRGLSDTITIPSIVHDGDTHLFFNHFGTRAKVPSAEGVRIGLFHQNVGSNDICKMWGTFDNVEEASYVQAYNYCFFGHMHLAKGKYFLNSEHTCQGEWLGTIGRTKVNEVNLEDLQVNIPVILVEDGKFKTIEDNLIELLAPAQCIDYVKLNAAQHSQELVKEKLKQTQSGFIGNSLFQTLTYSFVDTPHTFLLDFLDKSTDDVLHAYRQTLRNPIANTQDANIEEEV